MNIRFIVPVIHHNRLYQAGAVLLVSDKEGAELVRSKIAVPVPHVPQKAVVRPVEFRRVIRYV